MELVWQVNHLVASPSEHSFAEHWHMSEHEMSWYASRPLKSTMRARMPNCRSSAAASVVPTHFIVPCTFLHSHASMLSADMSSDSTERLLIAKVSQASVIACHAADGEMRHTCPAAQRPLGQSRLSKRTPARLAGMPHLAHTRSCQTELWQ